MRKALILFGSCLIFSLLSPPSRTRTTGSSLYTALRTRNINKIPALEGCGVWEGERGEVGGGWLVLRGGKQRLTDKEMEEKYARGGSGHGENHFEYILEKRRAEEAAEDDYEDLYSSQEFQKSETNECDLDTISADDALHGDDHDKILPFTQQFKVEGEYSGPVEAKVREKKKRPEPKDPRNITCYHCKQKGHKVGLCKQRLRDEQEAAQKRRNETLSWPKRGSSAWWKSKKLFWKLNPNATKFDSNWFKTQKEAKNEAPKEAKNEAKKEAKKEAKAQAAWQEVQAQADKA